MAMPAILPIFHTFVRENSSSLWSILNQQEMPNMLGFLETKQHLPKRKSLQINGSYETNI